MSETQQGQHRPPRIGVIDSNMGNLRSLEQALTVCGADPVRLEQPEDDLDVSGLILPGVGAFAAAVHHLDQRGWFGFLPQWAKAGHPLFGICVGCQVLFDWGDEGGERVDGFGLIPGVVRRLQAEGLKVPHIGWNTVEYPAQKAQTDRANRSGRSTGSARDAGRGPLQGVPESTPFYFVHSYRPETVPDQAVCGLTTYGETFASAVQWGSIWATQFHPEKSGRAGLKVLTNFIEFAQKEAGAGVRTAGG